MSFLPNQQQDLAYYSHNAAFSLNHLTASEYEAINSSFCSHIQPSRDLSHPPQVPDHFNSPTINHPFPSSFPNHVHSQPIVFPENIGSTPLGYPHCVHGKENLKFVTVSDPHVGITPPTREILDTDIESAQLPNVLSQIQAHGIDSLSQINDKYIKAITLLQDVANEPPKEKFRADNGAFADSKLDNAFSCIEGSEIHFVTVDEEFPGVSYNESATFYQDIEANEPIVNQINAINTARGFSIPHTLAPLTTSIDCNF